MIGEQMGLGWGLGWVRFRASTTITKAKIKSRIKGGRRTVKEYKKKEAKRV